MPGLGTLLVGDDPGSRSYVAASTATAPRSASRRSARTCRPTATQDEIEARSPAQRRPGVHRLHRAAAAAEGIDDERVLELIDPDKDADGLHPTNLGRLVLGSNGPITSPLPCTPARHRRAAAAARRRPRRQARRRRRPRPHRRPPARPAAHPQGINATVTLTHSAHGGPRRTTSQRRRRDRGRGRAIVQRRWIKPGAAVIDVGVSRSTDPETGKARRRRRRPRRRRGRRALAEPGRRRADDAGDAAGERGGGRGAPAQPVGGARQHVLRGDSARCGLRAHGASCATTRLGECDCGRLVGAVDAHPVGSEREVDRAARSEGGIAPDGRRGRRRRAPRS